MYGGIASNRWTWSTPIAPLRISTFSVLQICLMISLKSVAYVIFEDLLSVLSSPDNVILVIICSMTGVFVACHAQSILKSWAEAQSFPLGDARSQ